MEQLVYRFQEKSVIVHHSLALGLGRGQLLDRPDDGDDEGEAHVSDGDGEDPGEGAPADPRAGEGLGYGAGELDQVHGLLLDPWQVLLDLFEAFALRLLVFLGLSGRRTLRIRTGGKER